MRNILATLLLLLTPLAFAEFAPFTNNLVIPPILEGTLLKDGTIERTLIAENSTKLFFDGSTTATMGYNGDYLGPTIRVREGDYLKFRIVNRLGEATTLHWHGLHVPAEMDGGPRQVIPADETWLPEFQIRQQAATLWYHPHLMGKTAEHVYNGLAGFLIIDDDLSESLDLPSTYGVDDIPLVFQERRFNENGAFSYTPRMPDIMHGYLGNALLVNGGVAPRLNVPRTRVRLRLLNGSNSSIHRFRFEQKRPFSVIATDGGFLEKPTELYEIVLSPGERAEILVDFSETLQDVPVTFLADTYGGETYQAMQFFPSGVSSSRAIPTKLNADLPQIKLPRRSTVERTFEMQSMGMMGGNLTINGKRMDISRIDETVAKGETEYWEITNPTSGMMAIPHSFHVHDVQFRVVSINGELPSEWQRGRKDTVLIWPGDKTVIRLVFEEYLGIYMYHCHLLEHEEAGMMGQIEVIEP